jgi:hypothetical protein
MWKKTRPVSIGLSLGVTLVAMASLLAPGCAESGPEMGRVKGTVKYKGKPLTQGTISFVPTDPARRSANSRIAADGSYQLQSTEPGDGAQLGDYRVIVSGRDATALDKVRAPGEPVKLGSSIPLKYEQPDQSGLKATVKTGSQTLDYDLE